MREREVCKTERNKTVIYPVSVINDFSSLRFVVDGVKDIPFLITGSNKQKKSR